jgi:hypothetical protein
MGEKSKAQTVAERAARRAELGTHPTSHTCASPSCPSPAERITVGELYPVVSMTPHRHTIFFHRSCALRLVGPR